jgi:hypothetical protein
MSRPIKDTPILYGEDARSFIYNHEHAVKLPIEVRERMQKNYEKICNLSNGGNLSGNTCQQTVIQS